MLTVLQVFHILRKKEEMMIKKCYINDYTNDNIENDNKYAHTIYVTDITKDEKTRIYYKLVTRKQYKG
jgi:hypothetical protein